MALAIGSVSAQPPTPNPTPAPAAAPVPPSPVQFPPAGAVPPINPEWTKFYLANANIPKIPVRAAPVPSPDYSQTVTVCNAVNQWAQTWDDGPSPASNTLMDNLKARNVKTTFFNVGGQIANWPCIFKRKEAEGHMNCLHSWSHSAFTTLTNDQIVAEIVWNALAVRQTTGKSPRCFRPPYGDIDERVVAVLKAMGQEIIWLNLDTNDWQIDAGLPAAQILSSVVNQVNANGTQTAGIISLEHDLLPAAIAVGNEATGVIMTSNKFRLVQVDECTGNFGMRDGFRLPTVTTLPQLGAGQC
ncbi:chitin deacetylase [Phlyctochytrium planicorne]|nr:chitin deacetylase [Phlyctochytrium planicorne]